MKELFSEYPYLLDDRVILRRMTPEDAGEVIARMDEECFDTKESILLAICIKSDPQPQHTKPANRSDSTGSTNPTDSSGSANHFNPVQPVTTLPPVQVEQFVMAYQADHDRIRVMLPEGFTSLRPVLRINAEIRNKDVIYIEFNTPVEAAGRRGWLNIANWKSSSGDDLHYAKAGQPDQTTTTFTAPFLTLRFTATGTTGGCPAEKDNEGCYYLGNDTEFRPVEKIEEHKEFCDCEFAWHFHEDDAHGVGNGESRPVTSVTSVTPVSSAAGCEPIPLTAETAAAIPCEQVLGAYTVRFQRYGK